MGSKRIGDFCSTKIKIFWELEDEDRTFIVCGQEMKFKIETCIFFTTIK